MTGQCQTNVSRIDFCMNICLFVSKKIAVSFTTSKSLKTQKNCRNWICSCWYHGGAIQHVKSQGPKILHTTYLINHVNLKWPNLFKIRKVSKGQVSKTQQNVLCRGVALGGLRPPNFQNNKKSGFQQNAQSKVASIVFHSATLAPSAARLTVSLILCSSRSNTLVESRAVLGHSVSSKSPSRVRVRDEGVAGRKGRE